MNKIRIGTRGSRLALKQAALVQEALQAADDSLQTEIVILRTKGDNRHCRRGTSILRCTQPRICP